MVKNLFSLYLEEPFSSLILGAKACACLCPPFWAWSKFSTEISKRVIPPILGAEAHVIFNLGAKAWTVSSSIFKNWGQRHRISMIRSKTCEELVFPTS